MHPIHHFLTHHPVLHHVTHCSILCPVTHNLILHLMTHHPIFHHMTHNLILPPMTHHPIFHHMTHCSILCPMTHNLIFHPMTHPHCPILHPMTHHLILKPMMNCLILPSTSHLSVHHPLYRVVQGSSVVVSDSPVKPDPKLWLPHLNLYLSDRKIIHSSDRWLTNSTVCAAQSILKEQSERKIYGWMSPQLSKRKSLFLPVPPSSPFIQILHVDGCHCVQH